MFWNLISHRIVNRVTAAKWLGKDCMYPATIQLLYFHGKEDANRGTSHSSCLNDLWCCLSGDSDASTYT